MFEAGDKVKCINADWPKDCDEYRGGLECPLVLGEVYTVVAAFSKGASCDYKSGAPLARAGLQLAEVSTPYVHTYGGADLFPAEWFRKLPCIKQGMETLIAISDGSKTVEIVREKAAA